MGDSVCCWNNCDNVSNVDVWKVQVQVHKMQPVPVFQLSKLRCFYAEKTAATTKTSSYWLRAKSTLSSFPAAGAFCQYGDTIRKKRRTFRLSAVQQGWARPPPLSPPPLPAPPGSNVRRLFSGPLNSAEFLRSSEVSRRLGRRRHRCLLC